jgi:hypothetical protein
MLHRAPAPYGGRGRPRKHGPRFASRAPATWESPQEEQTFVASEWGTVTLRAWANLHDHAAKQPFGVVRATVHEERAASPEALWLELARPAATGGDHLAGIWSALDGGAEHRGAQAAVALDGASGAAAGAMQIWTVSVSLALLMLWLGLGLVADCRLPRQREQTTKTPGHAGCGRQLPPRKRPNAQLLRCMAHLAFTRG